jgi:hypothetical protein
MTPSTPNSNFGLTPEQRLAPSIARLQAIEDRIFNRLRVALPAIVQQFNPGPPATVDVVVATNELVQQNTGTGDVFEPTTSSVQLKPLQGLPIIMPGGGGWSLTFPIAPGDECYVLFADVPLEVWLQNGGLNNNPINQRRHNLSDGVAVFGMRSRPRGLSDYSTTSTQLRADDGAVVIDLAPDQITVTAPTVVVNSEHATVTGSADVHINGNKQTFLDGKNFWSHTHGGVQSGSGTTGPVNP